MKICELINKLNELKNQYGEDINVMVQYRDDGGDYYGADEEIRLDYSVNEDEREDNVILL